MIHDVGWPYPTYNTFVGIRSVERTRNLDAGSPQDLLKMNTQEMVEVSCLLLLVEKKPGCL